MNTKAYLVATLDTTQHPPVVSKAEIYSEDASGLTREFNNKSDLVDVCFVEGKTFQEARYKLLQLLSGPFCREHAWALKFDL